MTSQWRHRNKTHSLYSELNSLQNVYFGFFIFGKLTEWRCFVTYLSNDPRILLAFVSGLFVMLVLVVVLVWGADSGEVTQQVCDAGVSWWRRLWQVSTQCLVCQETHHRQGTEFCLSVCLAGWLSLLLRSFYQGSLLFGPGVPEGSWRDEPLAGWSSLIRWVLKLRPFSYGSTRLVQPLRQGKQIMAAAVRVCVCLCVCVMCVCVSCVCVYFHWAGATACVCFYVHLSVSNVTESAVDGIHWDVLHGPGQAVLNTDEQHCNAVCVSAQFSFWWLCPAEWTWLTVSK